MRSRDWSLVFLTILSQGSIGIVLFFTGLMYFSDEVAVPARAGLGAGIPLLLALVLIGVATAASFFHLGNPSNAPKALKNLSGSWLSREILAIGIFTFFLVAALVAGWAGSENGVISFILTLTSVAGLFLLWAMTRVYLIPTIPAWNNWYTPVSFTATTLCLGLIASLLLMDFEQSVNSFFWGVLTVILILELLSGLLNHHRLTQLDPGFDCPTFNQGVFYKLFLARMAILIIICVAMLFPLLQQDTPFTSGNIFWMYPILALVIIQEFAGRLMFYASYFRVGI